MEGWGAGSDPVTDIDGDGKAEVIISKDERIPGCRRWMSAAHEGAQHYQWQIDEQGRAGSCAVGAG